MEMAQIFFLRELSKKQKGQYFSDVLLLRECYKCCLSLENECYPYAAIYVKIRNNFYNIILTI